MNLEEYLDETKHAIDQLFDSLDYYLKMLGEINHPLFISSEPDEVKRKNEFENWYQDNKEIIAANLNKEKEYFGLAFSKATICGSILQIASMAIQMFSSNSKVTSNCDGMLTDKSSAVKYCIGREVRGLPIGLIIYAARNQYNHMDENKYHDITTRVFDKIATYNTGGKYRDPAFDLDNTELQNYAHNILAILGWKKSTDFVEELERLLK